MSETEQQIDLSRRLLSGSFQAILSTTSIKQEGYPFGSLVPYCLDQKDQPLLLLSHLSEHTKNLVADFRCAFTMAEQGQGDVQQLARLTGQADAERLSGTEEKAAAERYLRYFPSARPYYEELNFQFFRLRPIRFYFIGGFGAARWFGIDRILRTNPLHHDKEGEQLIWLNSQTILLDKIADKLSVKQTHEIRIVGVDTDGIDFRMGDQLQRLHMNQPITEDTSIEEISAQITR